MEKQPRRIRARGRCGFVVLLPCNWIKEGRCGADSKPCGQIEIVSSS